MPPGSDFPLRAACVALALFAGQAIQAAPSCDKPLYLTFDTGHMGVAELIADVLERQQVKATFFLANERTQTGGWSLDDHWAPWWRARAAEGHAFGTHTWDHHSWLADHAAGGDGGFDTRPSMGPQAGQRVRLTPAAYCAELKRPAARFQAMTGQAMLPLFRAPGGKTSPALLAAAQACGYTHVGWAPAGFLGDELPSERYPNAQLLQRALAGIRAGDILVAHLGIWSRREPWAPAVLEPLIEGLKARGFCFATLRDHPTLGRAAAPPETR
ncbi:polysaccharide deacetylase family protein [Ideonella sp. DXS22W]|uniref:Polysaccharide deacetylase family protein n=1 Tax=Pseudaquabacterium inlustre TaxID=2984192 RepID=A0ABU9CG37_9BURK